MTPLPGHIRRWWAGQVWLRQPHRAQALIADEGGWSGADGPVLALLSWITLAYERDEKEAEAMARAALQHPGDTRFASAVLAEVLMRRGEHEEALDVLKAARARYRDVPWYDITLADALVEAGRPDEAEALLQPAAEHPGLRRHALKRLAHLALERHDRATARARFEQLLGLAPDYLVYASDYVTLGRLQLQDGDADQARLTWRRGAEIYPRHQLLRQLLEQHFGEVPSAVPRVPPVAEDRLGVRRIPVRTPLITWRTGLVEVIERATAELRQPGDVIALSESAAAAGQGRMLPLELVQPCLMAKTLCRFVGEMGPLHSPAGMQGAVMEAGSVRVGLAAVCGALGKAVGRRGWFYRVAGSSTAMIDDVAACLPPHDHHVIFGPQDPDALARDLAMALACQVAIVDANHRSGAWVVGASTGVDRAWLAAALADNPAGNEDEQTPVVIVRRT